jgi:hypothetical protein
MSHLLDNAFMVPGTSIRVGLDSIIGLLPIVGDFAGAGISLLFVVQAIRIKAPVRLIIQMLINIAAELLIGWIPIVGDIFDIAWKSNRKNFTLMAVFIDKELGEQEEQGQITRLAALARDVWFEKSWLLVILGLVITIYLGFLFSKQCDLNSVYVYFQRICT